MTPPASVSGAGLVRLSWWVTALFTVASSVAVLVPASRYVVAVIDLVLFAGGCAAMLSAFAVAVQRSRTEDVSVPGVWFLTGSAPPSVRRSLMGSLAAQTVVAFVAAGIRPYTAVAFGILVPMCGLGLVGLWGARHGSFAPRRHPAADAGAP